MQIGEVPGRFRCRCGGQVPEGSGAVVRSGSGGLRCTNPSQVPEGPGTEVR